MTIGRYGYDLSDGPNPDFQVREMNTVAPASITYFKGVKWLYLIVLYVI